MSALSNAIAFMVNLGIYDVVLPFLLVFTMVFALLEKTKVLGMEKNEDGNMQPKQNLNAMIAFVAGFLVVASADLVRVINTVLANVVLLVLLSILFLMLVGSLSKDQEVELTGAWKSTLIGIMFAGIVLIFLHALGWLNGLWNIARSGVDGTVTATGLLLLIVVLGMRWITSGGSSNGNGNKGGEK